MKYLEFFCKDLRLGNVIIPLIVIQILMELNVLSLKSKDLIVFKWSLLKSNAYLSSHIN